MSATSTIEWTESTWNPVTGCTKVSPGCDNCYAETFAERWRGISGHPYEQGFDLKLWPERLEMPSRWRKPRLVFVNSMSDLFHDGVPDEYIAQVFAAMAAAPQHTFQVLTKRPGRMASLMRHRPSYWERFEAAVLTAVLALPSQAAEVARNSWSWPLPNVWLGTSVESQKWADVRIPKLVETPAAVRFLSCEPLLGALDFREWLPRLGWVIVGGESGSGARPMHPAWPRRILDDCKAAEVPFFFKQWGAWVPEFVANSERGAASALYVQMDGSTRPAARGGRGEAVTVQRLGKKAGGRLLDGREWSEFPNAAVGR